MNMDVKEVQLRCREEAHSRSLGEARGLARDDMKTAHLHGAAADAFCRKRTKHHYSRLLECNYQELLEQY